MEVIASDVVRVAQRAMDDVGRAGFKRPTANHAVVSYADQDHSSLVVRKGHGGVLDGLLASASLELDMIVLALKLTREFLVP